LRSVWRDRTFAAGAAALPENTSGSDEREIARRAQVAGDGARVDTGMPPAEVGSGAIARISEGM
jgi:cell division protease FtsH